MARNAFSRAVALSLGLAAAGLLGAPAARGGDDDPIAALEEAFARVAERAAPAVVRIEVDRVAEPAGEGKPVFTGRYGQRPGGPVSGVVVDAQGYILTSAYNVAGQLKGIRATLNDGRTVEAKLLGADENLDVALLKVEAAAPLPHLALAGDPAPRVGQFAIVVGRLAGEGPTVTTGIISATNRLNGEALQMDAAVNYASAGGALLDLDGRLLGVVSQVSNRSRTGLNSGVGFAAPAARLAKALEDLKAGRSIPRRKRPFLGIQGGTERFDLKGVEIAKVLPDSAAAKAGLKDGDVIKIFNGVEVQDFQQLAEEIGKLSPGQPVLITVVRDGWEKELELALGERKDGE